MIIIYDLVEFLISTSCLQFFAVEYYLWFTIFMCYLDFFRIQICLTVVLKYLISK